MKDKEFKSEMSVLTLRLPSLQHFQELELTNAFLFDNQDFHLAQ